MRNVPKTCLKVFANLVWFEPDCQHNIDVHLLLVVVGLVA